MAETDQDARPRASQKKNAGSVRDAGSKRMALDCVDAKRGSRAARPLGHLAVREPPTSRQVPPATTDAPCGEVMGQGGVVTCRDGACARETACPPPRGEAHGYRESVRDGEGGTCPASVLAGFGRPGPGAPTTAAASPCISCPGR